MDMDIQQAMQLLDDARSHGHDIYVKACLKYIVKMKPKGIEIRG